MIDLAPMAVMLYTVPLMLLYSYFFNGFLTPKYGRKTYIYSLFLFGILMIFSCLFYHQYLLKQVVLIVILVIILILFYEDSIRKKVLASTIFLSVTFFYEFSLSIISIGIFNVDLNDITNYYSIFIYIAYYLFLFHTYFALIQMKRKIFIFIQYKNIIIIIIFLCIQYFFFSTTAISITITSENIDKFILFIILVYALLNSVFLICVKKMMNNVKKEYTINLLKQEYEKELEKNMEFKGNEEEIRMLKHDIINYLEKNK